MPELPEVETIKSDLERIVLGKKITKVCVYNPMVIREPSPDVFRKSLEGLVIKKDFAPGEAFNFRAIEWFSFDYTLKDDRTVSAQAKLSNPGGSKNSRVAFHLSSGKVLDFNDQRLFGELRLVDDWGKIKFIQGLGPEPFDLTYGNFRDMLSKKKTKIKPLLMDQSFISGIGNLYAAEILFRAKIDPWRSARSLTEEEKKALYKETKEVLRSAITHGGSTVDNYVRLSGKPGNYLKFHRVYGREAKPCFVCKSLIKRVTQGGRGTYFCPKCQR